MDYFRVYDDLIDNPKFAAPPEDGGMSADTFRFWIWCLSMASRMPERDGRLPPLVEIAFRARVTLQEADAHLCILESRKLVKRDATGTASMVGWSTYQPMVPKSTQRVRKHRQRVKSDATATAKSTQSSPSTDETRFIAFQKRGETRCETVSCNDGTPLIDREKPPTESLSSTCSKSQTKTPTSATPQPPANPASVVVVDVWTAIEHVRAELGEDAARAIDVMPEVVDRDIGGRWDCLVAAVRAAKRSTRPIRDIRAYLVRTAKQFAHDGIPPEPVPIAPKTPRASPHPNANILTADPLLIELKRKRMAKEGRIHESE